MPEILDHLTVEVYSPTRDANESCLVARAWTKAQGDKLFRVTPEYTPAASLRIRKGIASCTCGQSGCVHLKAASALAEAREYDL